jgi:alkaline phosphatase D
VRQLSVSLLGLLFVAAAAAAADDSKPLSRIAFGSCSHQDREQPIWDAIVKEKPELFLFLGDNIYADTQDPAVMKKKYDKQAAIPGYQKLRKACPALATWDDHDYGGDDVGAEYPKKKESQKLFLDFFGVPKDSPRRKQEGVYNAATFGPEGKRVQVILLDMRYFRSPLKKDTKRPRSQGQYVANDDKDATMLGAAQWKWLEEQLRKPAEVRLICSSIQVVAEDHGFEKWMNMPRERAKLYALIRDTKASGVVFLSGDRHLAELSLMEGDAGYPFFDLTSSGLNQANKRWRALETNRHRVATMNVGDNYGVVRIDWQKKDPVVSLEIHDDEGDVTIRQKVPLSRLQFRAAKVKADEDDLAAEAQKHLDKEWKVTFTVNATGTNKAKTMTFLNSSKDFRSPKNLTIVLDSKALAKDLEQAKIADAAKHYSGKKIEVSGTVTLFEKRPQIRVKKLEQIRIVE